MGVLHLRYGFATFDIKLPSQIVSIYRIVTLLNAYVVYDMMMMVVAVVVNL